VELLRGEIALASGAAADAAPLLLAAARRLEPLDLALARETYLSACGAAMFAGPAGADDLLRVGRAVTALPPPTGDPRAVDMLLDGLALLITEGRRAAAPRLLQAAGAFAGDGASIEESLRWGWMATAAGNALWDDDGLRAVCRRQIEVAREAGALEQLPIYLIALATATARSGDFAAASSLVAKYRTLAGGMPAAIAALARAAAGPPPTLSSRSTFDCAAARPTSSWRAVARSPSSSISPITATRLAAAPSRESTSKAWRVAVGLAL